MLTEEEHPEHLHPPMANGNQNSDPGALVFRGVEGSGEAQILKSPPSDPLARFTRAKYMEVPDPELARKNKEAQDKQYDEYLDKKYDKPWEEQHPEVSREISAQEQRIQQHYNQRGKFTAQDKYNFKQSERRIEDLIDHSVFIGESFDYTRETMKNDPEIDWIGKGRGILFDKVSETNEKGERRRNIMNTSREEIESVLNDPRTYNMHQVWTNALKSFREQALIRFDHKDFGDEHGITREEYGAKWFKRNDDGTVATTEDDIPKIGLNINDKNDEAKKILMQHPKVANYVRQARAAGMSESDIWQMPGQILGSFTKELETESRKFVPEHIRSGGGKGNPNVAYSKSEKQYRNIAGAQGGVDQYYVDEEIAFDKGMDKNILVKPNNIYYLDTNSKEEGPIGDVEMIITSLQNIPWNFGVAPTTGEITGGEEGQLPENFEFTLDMMSMSDEQLKKHISTKYPKLNVDDTVDKVKSYVAREADVSGHIRFGELADLNKGQRSSIERGYKWMAQGIITDKKGNRRQVLVPYEDVRAKLRAVTSDKYGKGGIDLYERPLYSRSNNELYDIIRRFLVSEGEEWNHDIVSETIKDIRKHKITDL